MKSPKSGEPRSILSAGGGAEKRCCLKTTKHHRWKRKWNCCSAVPDSPDVSEDVIRTISDSIANSTAAATTVDVVQTMSLHDSPAPMLEVPDELYQQQQRELRQQLERELLVKEHYMQQLRPPRLNGMVRTCSTEKKLDCATIATFRYPTSATACAVLTRPVNSSVPNHQANEYVADQVQSLPPQPPSSPQKNFEQRPRMMRPWAVMRFRHVLRMFGRYRGRSECRGRSGGAAGPSRHNDDSTSSRHNQVRPTSETAAGAGEPLTWYNYGSSSSSSDSGDAADAVQSIPLSGHRNRLPVLPPPSRRKIRNPTDLQELSNSLSFVSSSSSSVSCSSSRFLPSGSVRRMRRKNAMRQLSPTLSPIQESGLSNPTSPQPFRHAGSSMRADGATLLVDGKVICVNDA